LAVEIVLSNGRRLRGIEGLSAVGLTQLIRVLESA
jgi:transposase